MVDMGTTTKLTAPSIFADGDHAHDVAILLAEQVHGTQGDGVVELHLLRGDGKVFAQLLVDTRLDGVHRILLGALDHWKSKRKRFGASSEPRWVACGPSSSRSALCTMWSRYARGRWHRVGQGRCWR